MKRQLMFAGCVAVMTVAAWIAGAAQARVADFSITVDAPVGEGLGQGAGHVGQATRLAKGGDLGGDEEDFQRHC